MKHAFLSIAACVAALIVSSPVVDAAGIKFGSQCGSYNNVTAWSNYDNAYWSGESSGYGSKWQCVEYINRYYAQIYGKTIQGGDARSYYLNATAKGLFPFSNDGTTLPQPGDILCFDGGAAISGLKRGHVAIIREVTTTSVVVIHQNWANTTADDRKTFSMTVTGGRYYVKPVGSGTDAYTCQGWVRAITNTAPTIANLSSSSDSQGNVTVNFTVNDTTGDRVSQTDLWVRSGTSTISGTYVNGTTYTLGAHRVVIPVATLRGRLLNGSYYTVGVRAYDSAWLSSGDKFSNSFAYTLPAASTAPEIAIKYNGTEISTGSQSGVGNFGTVNVNTADYRSYTVANTGTGTLTVGALNLSNSSDFSIYSYPASSVAPGQTTSFTLKFYPCSSGSKSCTLSLTNNDSNENPYYYTVTGTGQGASTTTTNAMDRFATTYASWLGSFTGYAWQDSSYSYRQYKNGIYLANRIGTNEVLYYWNGTWYNGGTW